MCMCTRNCGLFALGWTRTDKIGIEFSAEECVHLQVKNGKGSMPAWADSLSPENIVDVAAYVYNQADKDLW